MMVDTGSEGMTRVLSLLQAVERIGDDTVEGGRARLEALAEYAQLAPDVRFEPVDVDGIPAEWVQTPGAVAHQVLLYLHGGSYLYGSINTHRELASRLSRAAQARVLLIAYRLGPENPFPAAVEDGTAVYRWLLRQGFEPENLVIAGDSAGGGLTLATLVALRNEGEAMPAAAVCFSPWTDLAGTGESMRRNAASDPMCSTQGLLHEAQLYLNGADPRHPLASPLYADLHGLSPMLLQVAEPEILLDDSTRFAERADAAGVDVTLEVWEGMIHVWQAFAQLLPEGQRAIERAGDFVRWRLQR